MAYSDSSSSGAGGGAPPTIWLSSLDSTTMEELHRYGPLVPPGCWLVKPWRVGADGYATLGTTTTAEELRTHRDGRYNIHGRHIFWDGKSFGDIINHHWRASVAAGNPVNPGGSQRRRRSVTPQASQVALPLAPPEVDLPPEQVVLREDGDPDDSSGPLVALRASQATAVAMREEAEIAAAIQPAAALAANPQPIVEDDDGDDDID
ncbi:hypothetical protein D1007_27429 [Hordeum vulgare]|nr:hypothetical protein D1007_27429 [Hordeum vulgare]